MNKKVVTFVVAMVLLLGVTMGVTFALMTAKTGTLTNTFVAGNFGTLALTEHKWGITDAENGTYGLTEETIAAGTTGNVAGNSYDIYPGAVLPKDPWVDFSDNTSPVESYIYVMLSDGWTIADGVATYSDNNLWFNIDSGWNLLDGTDNVIYRTLAAKTNLDASNGGNIIADAKVYVDQDATSLSNVDLAFSAYAIQSVDEQTVVELWSTVSEQAQG